MGSAFDSGVTKMISENTTRQGVEKNKDLRAELSFLREKLGFQHRTSPGLMTSSTRPSSRQIPVGKKLHITRRRTRNSDTIGATVIKNNDVELVVKLAMPMEGTVNELWRARYYFGTSVWEFDTLTIRCNGNILVLNHSDKVRFVNRRRFLRVSVNKPSPRSYKRCSS